MTPRQRGRLVPALMIVIFALPSLAALAVYHGPGWPGIGQAAAGRLITPSVVLPGATLVMRNGQKRRSTDIFTGAWTLLQMAPAGCGPACRRGLVAGRQVRALLHIDAARVQRALIVGDNTAPESFAGLQPDVVVYRTNVLDWRRLFSAHHADGPGTIQLIDPAGQWMASYPPAIGADALYHDITRLLAVAGRP